MDGNNAQQYASAFDVLVRTVERIVASPYGLAIVLFLLVLSLAVIVLVLNRRRYKDLSARLTACEQRHGECATRERRNMLAIATLHGVVCTLHQALPPDHPMRRSTDHVRIPTLAELLSGDPTTASAYNPEAAAVMQ